MLITAINFLLSLSLLIILHELGHFIPARLFGTRVEKFFLFFDINFSLFKKKIGETLYGIGWLPLGGYVKIAGMIDESMDKEQMVQEPQPWEFRSKPAWQRLIIMLGGVFVNVVVGFLIYILLIFTQGTPESLGTDYKYGMGYPKVLEKVGFQQGDQPILVNGDTLERAPLLNKYFLVRDVKTVTVMRDGAPVEIQIPEDIGDRIFKAGAKPILTGRFPFKIEEITPGSYAEDLGVEEGGTVTSIAGHPIRYQTDVDYAVNNFTTDDEEFTLVTEKGGVVKEYSFLKDEEFKKEGFGILMLTTDMEFTKQGRREYSFTESISAGISKGYWTMHDYLAQMKYLFSAEGASQLGGFGTIAKLYPDSFDWVAFWSTTAWISFVLAVMNILPIPALDGGHVMFLLYEMITGRPPGEKFMERAQIVGIVILLALMLFANGNDLYRWLFG
ncbi:MAG: RIP metalloprotease RseP [Nonlabens sp.]